MDDEPDSLVLRYLRQIDGKLDRIVSDLGENGTRVGIGEQQYGCDPRLGTSVMRYTVLLEREKDGGYVASVPALPGCNSQGNSRPEAVANIREAIELYIEDCRAAGDPVPSEADKEFIEVEAA